MNLASLPQTKIQMFLYLGIVASLFSPYSDLIFLQKSPLKESYSIISAASSESISSTSPNILSSESIIVSQFGLFSIIFFKQTQLIIFFLLASCFFLLLASSGFFCLKAVLHSSSKVFKECENPKLLRSSLMIYSFSFFKHFIEENDSSQLLYCTYSISSQSSQSADELQGEMWTFQDSIRRIDSSRYDYYIYCIKLYCDASKYNQDGVRQQGGEELLTEKIKKIYVLLFLEKGKDAVHRNNMQDLHNQRQKKRQQHLLEVSQLKQEIDLAHLKAQQGLYTLKSTHSSLVSDGKLTMQYNYAPKLKFKTTSTSKNPFLKPEKQLVIKFMGDRHQLLFNLFNVYDKHLLVTTREFQSQKEKISHGDMANSALACQALQGILFFNGGELSGASQPHKHLQILPNKARELPIFKQMHEFAKTAKTNKNEVLRYQPFNFMHGIVVVQQEESFQSLGDSLYEGYLALYEELIVKSKAKNPAINDYNVIACDRFILMAVRAQELALGIISVNSLGYMGSILFKDENLYNDFLEKHKPTEILESISFK